jgi:hypothetical protein
MTPTMEERMPGVWRLAFATFRDAPPKTRRIFAMMTGNWLLLIVLQLVLDSDGGDTLYDRIELMSLLLGGTGALLLMCVHVLNRSTEECNAPGSLVFTRMLAALPVFGAVAGMFVSSAVVLYIARAMIVPAAGDTIIMLLLAGIFAFVAGFAVMLIRESVLYLYAYATRQTRLAADASALAARAELRALQAQMNPHFLFNALNTVAALVRSDPPAAERTVENLADVLRMTLHRSDTVDSTVRAEAEYLRAYLAIEQARFGDRLRVEWDIADDTLDLPLPPLMLQPLVENSIRHGIGARASGGTLRIHAAADADGLLLRVEDDGEGFDERGVEGYGIGNLRRRLQTMFGDSSRLTITSSSTGSSVSIRIPIMVAA